MPHDPGRTIALTAFALVMFAANSLLCRMALGTGLMDAASFSLLRLGSGALMLAAIVALRGGGGTGGDRPSAFWLFLYAVPFSFAYLGLGAGMGALVLFGSVQVTMLLTALWSGERPSPLQWTGLAVALGGLVYLVAPGLAAPPLGSALLMALAGVAWGFYTLRGRGAGDPLGRNAGNFLRSVPFSLAVMLALWPEVHATPKGMGLAVLSGALASALGYAAWYAALRRLSATRAATVQLSVPVLAAIGGVVLLSEVFTVRLAAATALVLGGVWLTLLPPRSG